MSARREVSLAFVTAFCRGDIDELGELLTEDYRFEGPFLRSTSRSEYLERLREDPPGQADFEVERIFEYEDDTCVLYVYSKAGASTRIAQWNRFRGDRIARTTLVFDGRAFA